MTTYFSYRHTADDISADLENEFDFQVEEITRQITGRIQNYQQVLLGVRGLFAVSHETAREEFKTYVNTLRLKENYPGIQGVGFAQIVPPGGLDGSWVDAALARGAAGFLSDGAGSFAGRRPGTPY